MASTSGDVHLERDGATIDFHGRPYVAYEWLTDRPLRVEAALQPCYGSDQPETTIHRLAVTLGDGSTVVVDETGLTRITTPGGYWLDIHRSLAADGPLAGHPHLDLYLIEQPASFNEAAGVLPRFEADHDPAAYEANRASP